MKAYLYLQPDDRNHLYVSWNLSIRLSLENLKELLEGRADFVEMGVYSEEAKQQFREVARLFKEGRITKIIIKNYSGVKPEFEFEASPNDILIEIRRFNERILHIKGKAIIVIRPLYDMIVFEEK